MIGDVLQGLPALQADAAVDITLATACQSTKSTQSTRITQRPAVKIAAEAEAEAEAAPDLRRSA